MNMIQLLCGYHVESLLGSPMPFSIHRTIIITNALIKQKGSSYVITNFDCIWDISQYTCMISLLLHLTSAPPWSHIITTISSSYWDIPITNSQQQLMAGYRQTGKLLLGLKSAKTSENHHKWYYTCDNSNSSILTLIATIACQKMCM